MERREFFRGFAAALAAASTLPEIAEAVSDYLAQLRVDLASAPDEKTLWERVQSEFLLEPGLMHFNNGSIGSTPRPIVEAHKAYIERFEADAYRHAWSGFSDKRLADVTPKAARFLNADSNEILLTRNTTEGMNLVATGIRLQAGDEILTTDHEHAGGINCWHHMAQMQDVVVKKIHLPDPVTSKAEILERVEDGITPRTRVCSFSHLTTTTGLIMPMAEIAQITRPKGILLVCDGAQAPGMLDVDVGKLMVDAYASSSHKWMLAPKGSGLLYVRKEAQDRIRPVAAYASVGSQYAAYSGSVGTRNTPMLLAHGDTMDFHNVLGRDRVEARTRQLTRYLRQQLSTIPSLTPVTPDDPELSAAMTSYTVEGLASVSGLFSELKKRHINVKSTGYSSVVLGIQVPVSNVRVLRLSTHIYNSESQIDRLAEAIRDIIW
ncbi:MAG: aminotransferase class V-fold PLP-dependent enzyme [Gemmatimonadetes bacterium]|nr:aminotransferase class V-fold PLP-dependent enzyme [Gemmatimonadota bacterium]